MTAKDPAEESALKHGEEIYKSTGDSHSQCSEEQGFMAGVSWCRKHELKEAEKRAFEAAREETLINAHDPNGARAESEKYLPPSMKTIGCAVGWKRKYETFDDYKKEGGG